MQFKDKVVNLVCMCVCVGGGCPAEVSLGEGNTDSAENELQGLDYDQSVEGQRQKEREGKQHDNELRDTKRQRQRICRKGRGGDEASKGDRNRVLND